MASESDRHNRAFHLLAIAAARLSGELNYSQKDIMKRLNKSQSMVSRLLSHAKERGLLVTMSRFVPDKATREDLAEVEREYFGSSTLSVHLSRLAPGGLEFTLKILPEGEDEFTVAAAGVVTQLLRRSRCVGIMWGRTVHRLVAGISARMDSRIPGVRTVPLSGDPVHMMNLRHVRYSSSFLAAELGKALDPDQKSDLPCLVGVPAYLPVSNQGKQFVRSISGYREIFGTGARGEDPLVNQVDTIITGMGVIAPAPRPGQPRYHDEAGDFIRERLNQEKISQEDLSEMIYGDIGGWLLEKPGLKADKRKKVEHLNEGWNGATSTQLKTIAKMARAKGPPGVIVVAAGVEKAQMVIQVIKGGFVNYLLIDTSLANGLQAMLGQSDSARRPR